MMKKYTYVFLFFLSGFVKAQNPALRVIDTDFSKGRLQHIQTITLNDAAKLHGHICDGLVLGFLGLREALYALYPDSVIDRTNTQLVSKSSPCITDIAIYLTGARYQYGTFYVSDSINYLYIVQRVDTKKTVGVNLKKGFKPAAIDSMGKLAIRGNLDACSLDSLRKMEDRFTMTLLDSDPHQIFNVEEITRYEWKQDLKGSYLKTDILNKDLKECKK